MPVNAKLLAARRIYQFEPDAVRLSTLVLPTIQDAISAAFGFRSAGIQAVQPAIGAGIPTEPPGVTFQAGSLATEDGLIPIRSIAIDARRLAIEVVAETSVIDYVFERLKLTTAEIGPTATGNPILGAVEQELDGSEFSLVADFDSKRLFREPVALALEQHLGGVPLLGSATVPAFSIYRLGDEDVFLGPLGAHTRSAFELRAGTTPASRTYWSAAPLTTDAHRAYLADLLAALAA